MNSKTLENVQTSSARLNSFLLFIKSFSFITNTNEILLIEQHWTPIIKQALKLTTLNVENVLKSFDSYSTHIKNSFPLVSRFEFLFEKSDTLQKAVIEYIMFKMVDYPVITTRIITKAFNVRYSDYASQFTKGSIRSTFNDMLDEFYIINLLDKQIIEGTRPKNTNMYLAFWHKPKNIERVMEIYGYYKKLEPKKATKTKKEKVHIEVEKKEIRDMADKIHKKKKLADPTKLKEEHDLKVADNLFSAEISRTSDIAKKKVKKRRVKKLQTCSISGCNDFIKLICKHCGQVFCNFHASPGGKKGHQFCLNFTSDELGLENAKIPLKYNDFDEIVESVNLQLNLSTDQLLLEDEN